MHITNQPNDRENGHNNKKQTKQLDNTPSI